MELPPPLEASSTPPGPRKRTLLDKAFRYLPAGSRRVVGAMALGAMEMMSDGKDNAAFEKADALNQASDLIQEQKKDQLKRDMEAADATVQSEKLDEIRKKLRKG